MAAKGLRFAGDVEIREISITSLNGQTANITNQVEMVQIYEDLFANFTTVDLTVIEAVDYINLFPFCGEEYVEIYIDTPTMNVPIKGRFYVTKIDNYIRITERSVGYVLHAVSEEWFIDANTKVNRPLKGNVSELVSTLFSRDSIKTKKTINIEPTINKTKFIPNYWTPSKCINYLCTSGVNTYGNPSYLFFENRNGFNFVSVDTLLAKDVKHTFIKDNYTRTQTKDSTVVDVTEDYKRIIDFKAPIISDYIANIDGGQIKSKMITHDLTTKKYQIIDYSIKTDKNTARYLNKYPAYSKRALVSAAANIMYVPKYTANFTDYADVSNAKITQRRLSSLQMLKKYTINIEVYGRTDYTVGSIVDLFIPRATQINNPNEAKDLILSGKYIISAINHTIDRENHTCHMELIKNSLLIDLDKQ